MKEQLNNTKHFENWMKIYEKRVKGSTSKIYSEYISEEELAKLSWENRGEFKTFDDYKTRLCQVLKRGTFRIRYSFEDTFTEIPLTETQKKTVAILEENISRIWEDLREWACHYN